VVHKHNGDKMKFLESSHGLYNYDAKSKNTSANYSFINSVQENRSMYTKRQNKDADLATRVYELVGRPSHATFTAVIRENQLRNCPINVDDANHALHINGTNVDALRGKTTRTTPDHIPSNQIRPLPSKILEKHRDVTLCFDIFFVDGLAFVGTVARSLHFLTVEYIKNRTILTHVFPCLQKVHHLYKARGFKITMTHADEELTSLQHPLLELDGIGLNIAATNEHVPEMERAIRTIKERNRSTVSGLPYKHYSTILKKALVSHAISWLNTFPHADGVSETMSPRTILTGVIPDYAVHCRVLIGAYCEVHNENDPSNTETPRTSPVIAIDPTGNLQGSYCFLSLATGKCVKRRKWTELPITDDVIARVHELACAKKSFDPAPNFVLNGLPTCPSPTFPLNTKTNHHCLSLQERTTTQTETTTKKKKKKLKKM
jgi:hypothetical protein